MKSVAIIACVCLVWIAAIAGAVYLTLHDHWGIALVILLCGFSVSAKTGAAATKDD